MENRLFVLACETLASELSAVLTEESGVETETLPPICMTGGTEALRIFSEHVPSDRPVLLAGCVPPVPDFGVRFPHVRLLGRGPCTAMIGGAWLVDSIASRRGYAVTSGWIASWEQHVAKWGFDRSGARCFFHEFADHIVLLDTGIHEGSGERSRAFSEFLDMPTESVSVGLEFFRALLLAAVRASRLQEERERASRALRKSSEYAMTAEMLGEMAKPNEESGVAERLFDICSLLFAPRAVVYAAVEKGSVTEIFSRPANADATRARAAGTTLRPEEPFSAEGENFLLRIAHGGEMTGVLSVEGAAFPAHVREYTHLAASVLAPVAGLAAGNARVLRDLRQVLAQREMLLKEIHHRVKNNLAFVASLLSLQEMQASDERLRTALRDGIARVQSVSLIHDFLYRGNDLDRVGMHSYMKDLGSHMASLCETPDRHVVLHLESDEIYLDQRRAVACGMILSELLTNTFKYAFPASRPLEPQPEIAISLRRSEGHLVLRVADNGVGANAQTTGSSKLGTMVVSSLAKQLGGTVRIETDRGFSTEVRFPETPK